MQNAIQWWMQAASKSSQGGNLRGDLEDNCMTLHVFVAHKPGGNSGGIWKTVVVGYFHGITKLLNAIF